MFRGLTGEITPDERSGTFVILLPTHTARTGKRTGKRTYRAHTAHILSHIDYTSIEHEIANLSFTSLLPFSLMFEIKEENYYLFTLYH